MPMGRPKLDERKEVILGIRVLPEERVKFKSAAAEAGLKLSEWARQAMHALADKPTKRKR